MEAVLTERIGDAGKRLHTGRSRNDQVALDMKLYTRDEIDELDGLVKSSSGRAVKADGGESGHLYAGLYSFAEGPAHHAGPPYGGYFEMFDRDRTRLSDIRKRMNYCPLGSGALAGTTYPLDREYTAELLGFDGPTLNSMDSVADRDYVIELFSALSTIAMHLSRFCEEIII